MTEPQTGEFMAGVIEGFYGKPWTQPERFELFDNLAAWGLNTYLYAPKDDLKHRTLWREPYDPAEAAPLRELIAGCQARQVRFIYALSPGLDIRYSSPADLQCLHRRFEQMRGLGCQDFALLFDDIPDRMDEADLQRWGSLPAAQAQVAHAAFAPWQDSSGARFLFCPTPYCGRMAAGQLGGEGYLQKLGAALPPWIHVFWTGPEIISREITVEHIREVARWLRRKPLIWDNLHANDYDGRRFYCGPYSGRTPNLKAQVSGLLSNPNNEFPLNYVAVRTLGQYVSGAAKYEPREAYLSALKEWHRHFETAGAPIAFEDLLLLADSYYLPHEEGPEAERLINEFRALLASAPASWGSAADAFRARAGRLRNACARMADLRDRPLFYALSRRVWELREEMDLLDRYVQRMASPAGASLACTSDFHLPSTYRGGLVARLQRLLAQDPDGTFRPNPAGLAETKGTTFP